MRTTPQLVSTLLMAAMCSLALGAAANAQETGIGGRPRGAQSSLPTEAGPRQEAKPEPAPQQQPSTANAPRYIEREFQMPWASAGTQGLDVLEVRADLPGRHPLLVMTHGTSNDATARAQVSPWSQLPQALWFARRGFVALVVVRRGYGHSGGERDAMNNGCATAQRFEDSANSSIEDLKAAMRYMAAQPYVDGSRIVSAGVSTGGFAQVALSANPPPGLRAAINFSGGRGGYGDGTDCNWDTLVGAFRDFGAHSRLPMLWLYAQNDKWFPANEAVRFDKAFHGAGGQDDFQLVPPYGTDGHAYVHDIDEWTPRVERFLAAHGLLPLSQPLPPPAVAAQAPPPQLSAKCSELWQTFEAAGPFRAFAVTERGACGYSTAQFTQQAADEKALAFCKTSANGNGACSVYSRGSVR